ncbi:E3 ubiquitin-protein ligase DMA2 [Smittium culicis]|uniref:E3 ubiquitin-protein ligase DMA2 n=1 Tax=Smittium culicis TaxID=133412 RepID=A0A1R1Y4Y5_9FUNG|nr:E3 ubiquitin-protein ligase DMA2 [Smittium culicis]
MFFLNPAEDASSPNPDRNLQDRGSAAPSIRSQTASANLDDPIPLSPSDTHTSNSSSKKSSKQIPHIRIAPHIVDVRHCLYFDVIDRQVPENTIIKVGRFTDKVSNQQTRIAFKSKVVSRSHAEIWTQDGSFFIRDTKSSSGTFLNSMRLSPPGVESVPFPIKDGDILQLGVDYQGGTLDIYKCVKIRVEINRKWQRTKGNNFRKQILKNIQNSYYEVEQTKPNNSENTECCICLYNMLAFQALFVSPCSHCFHFKCVKQLLFTSSGFSCPLCRTYADLEASVSDDELVDDDEDEEVDSNLSTNENDASQIQNSSQSNEGKISEITNQLPVAIQIVQSQFSNTLNGLSNNPQNTQPPQQINSPSNNIVSEHVSNSIQEFQNELDHPTADNNPNYDTSTNASDSYADLPLSTNSSNRSLNIDHSQQQIVQPSTPSRTDTHNTTSETTATTIASQNGSSTPISTINNLNIDQSDTSTPVGSIPSTNILSISESNNLLIGERDDCISHHHQSIINNIQTTNNHQDQNESGRHA